VKERKKGREEKGRTGKQRKMFCRDSGVDEKKYCIYYKCDFLHKNMHFAYIVHLCFTAAPSDLNLPRLSLELEFLISGIRVLWIWEWNTLRG
jgi:hypothetical protein